MSILKFFGIAFVFVLVFAFADDAVGQGKGKGNSGGKAAGRSHGTSGKNSDDPQWDRNDRGKGRKNNGLVGSENRFKGLSKKLGRSPESLRDWYEAERVRNPDLNYGQFVAANMIAKNHPGVSADTILDGLRRGDSIGQTLKRHGWKDDSIRRERTRLRDLKDRSEESLQDYLDRDRDWRF